MTADEGSGERSERIMSGTALWFGAFNPPQRIRRPLSPRTWTCVAALAIPLWATWPALALRAFEMPAFECLTVAFLVGWLVLRGIAPTPAEPPERAKSKASWWPALACAIGLSGSNGFHILATHSIPAAQANLISYLWPVMIVAFGAMLRLFALRPRQILGLALGFAGAVILLGDGRLSMSPGGIGMALLSGVCWALYCLFRLKWTGEAADVLARGCALSTVLCAALHCLLEPTIIPSAGALSAAAAVGILPLALGNLAWDEGFRRGDSRLLAVMAYATPLCSALLLGALGMAALTWSLLAGAAVIVLAGFLSRA
jgi:drug/metabolite transporter (DMT)-like permease